ncbi:MAG: efflux RND transporter permease subunit, partial [Zavarzinella sp.]|nr:efflux RND transporter permease subunit [Zavarzinella sp.]
GLKADDHVVRDPARHRAGEEVRPQPVKEPAAKAPGLGMRMPAASPPAPFPGSGPALVVTTTYAGATAQTVEEAVAGPIEAQLIGLEKMTRQIAACADDGTMRLTLLFERGTDLNAAQRQAQDRIALALPLLPKAVLELGIRVEKRGIYLGAVALVSPGNRHDRVFLANYAKVNLHDDLARIGGVADVAFYGDTEPGKQIHLLIDRDKVAALEMTTSEILDTLSHQGLSVEAAPGGRILTLTVAGRGIDPDQLKEIMVKAGKEGRIVRLGTVARIETAEGLANTTRVDGKPAAILVISRLPEADAKDTAKALRDYVADLAKRLPEGVEVKVIDGGP